MPNHSGDAVSIAYKHCSCCGFSFLCVRSRHITDVTLAPSRPLAATTSAMAAPAEDPWAVFGEDDGEVQEVAAGVAAVTTSDAPTTVAAAAAAADAPPAAAAAATATPSAPAPAPAAPATAPAEPRIRVSVPLQHTLPTLARFMQLHAGATLEDIHYLVKAAGLPPVAAASGAVAGGKKGKGGGATRVALTGTAEEVRAAAAAAGALAAGIKLLHDAALTALPRVKGGGGGGGRGKAGGGGGSGVTDAQLDEMAAAAAGLHESTWAWMAAHGSWPHVVFREAYVMGRLAAAVVAAHRADVLGAMEGLDMALILGAPGEELEDVVSAVELGCVAAAAVGPDLPTIPPLLTADAHLRMPTITAATAVPRVAAAGPPPPPAPKRGGGGGGGGGKKRRRGGAARGGRPPRADDGSGGSDSDSGPAAAGGAPPAGEHPTLAAVRSVPGLAPAVEGVNPAMPLTPAAFRKLFVKEARPVVLMGATEGWAGRERWRDLTYLTETYGHRTVPVEIGQHLTGCWRESPMCFADFIATYLAPCVRDWGWGRAFTLAPPGGAITAPPAPPAAGADGTTLAVPADRVAYLAQHMLFHQLPRLTNDLTVPAFAGEEVGAVNAWFGTAGTVTRLHFDSYENLLTQVVGYKYVRLYAPAQTPNLYVIAGGAGAKGKGKGKGKGGGAAAAGGAAAGGAAAGGAGAAAATAAGADATTVQGNISAIDAECPDPVAHPLAVTAPYLETVLGPGDMLYIPAGWWHYVRSMTPSFSINFWW